MTEIVLLRERYIAKVVKPVKLPVSAMFHCYPRRQKSKVWYSPRFTTYFQAHEWLSKELATNLDSVGKVTSVFVPIVTQYIQAEENPEETSK